MANAGWGEMHGAERLRFLVDAVPALISYVDMEFRYRFVNESYRRWFGRAPAEIEGRHVRDVLGDAAWRSIRPYVERALAGEDVSFEQELSYLDGGPRWARVTYTPHRNAAGTVCGLVALINDVSARKRAELSLREHVTASAAAQEARRESEARFRNLADHAPVMIWVTDPEGRCTYLNRRWFEFTGQQSEEALGLGWLDAVHPEDVEVTRLIFTRANQKREPFRLDYRLRRRDGEYRWAIDAASPRFSESGEFLGYVGSVIDITERKQTEQAVGESEERFRTLADNIAQFAWMADPSGWIFWYNRRWFEYTGTTLAEMQGWGWRQVHHPDHVQRVVEKFGRAVASGESWEDTFPLRGTDGTYRWFLSRAIPIRDEQGRVLRWFGTNTDVTEQRRAEEALQEADRRKDEFIALLGHELRNPLSAIVNGIEVLNSLGGRDERTQGVRSIVERQARHMTRLVDDLLDVTRITRGKIALRCERSDIVELIRHSVDDHRTLLDGSGCTLELALPAKPVCVDVDPTRVAQVLDNLLRNAAKFTDAGGRITLEVTADAGRRESHIAVRDTGIGMSSETLGRLFEPFNQADTSLDRSRGGLGLGLALVRGLVEMHGGRISVHSDGLGRGSEFLIVLPLAAADALAVENKGAEPLESNRPLRILVVEDSVPVARIFGMMLEDLGHQPQIATNGAAALEQLPRFRPDVLFSDISMPGMNGYELVREIRAGDRGGQAYLVAMTGFGQPEDRDRALAAGFDEHLVKPAGMDQLRDLLRHVASRNGIPRD